MEYHLTGIVTNKIQMMKMAEYIDGKGRPFNLLTELKVILTRLNNSVNMWSIYHVTLGSSDLENFME